MDNNTQKGCKYKGSWLIDIETALEKTIPCEHKLYKDTGYCVFHAPLEEKEEIDFWVEFSVLRDKVEERFRKSEEKDKNQIFLNCQEFIFPEALYEFKKNEMVAPVVFKDSVFTGMVDFSGTVFNETTVFKQSDFSSWSNFKETLFKDKVYFVFSDFGTEKKQPASFMEAVFEEQAFFGGCRFYGDAVFSNTVFKKVAEFSELEISGRLVFRRATFLNTVAFFRIGEEIAKDENGTHLFIPSLREIIKPYVNASLEQVFTGPETRIIFKNTDLGGWALSNTPVIELARFEDVTWKAPGKPKRNHTRDEVLANSKEISWETVADVYRRLRLNYEKKLAYGHAGDFFVGQMIMYRKHLFKNRKILRWFFSWVYNLFSRYGESIWLPLGWLGVVFIGAALSYWLSGQTTGGALRSSFLGFVSLKIKLYEGVAGWLVPSLQRIIGIPLITLFILALRRAFRR